MSSLFPFFSQQWDGSSESALKNGRCNHTPPGRVEILSYLFRAWRQIVAL